MHVAQNYPNPANEQTAIKVAGLDAIALELYDLSGRLIYQQAVGSGIEKIVLQTAHLENGTYLYKLINSDNQSVTKKLEIIH